jgi:hypothetical protein
LEDYQDYRTGGDIDGTPARDRCARPQAGARCCRAVRGSFPHRRSWLLQVLAALVLSGAALAVVIASNSTGSSARASGRWMGSMFQDDDHLIYTPSTATVTRTLATLKRLGVNEIRATVKWSAIAPDSLSRTRPPRFQAIYPADYSPAAWAPYDRLVELAHARGISVNFDVTGPGPLWANAKGAPSTRYADHWYLSSREFGEFVRALGLRYSGHFKPPGSGQALPRVSFWSIWNEPNQPGWLSPQWRSSRGRPVMEAPVLYRAYVNAAFRALLSTGHRPSTDTILVGELAPEGCVQGVRCIYPRTDWPIPPLPFLRAVYCVGATYHPLTGSSATELGCPASGDPRSFVSANPALFQATGFAHHPYSFFLAPDASIPTRSFAPLSDLGRLEHALDSILGTYGISRPLPIYLTEYGYETTPNPYRGLRPAVQALYLNEAQYLAWRYPRVATLAQFLLYDSPPDSRYPPGTFGHWDTFQTGLLYQDGKPKPSFYAYRLPIFLPDPVLRPGRRVLVWALLRAAPPNSTQRAQIQWRSSGGSSFRTLQTVTTHNEDLAAMVSVPGPGSVRIQWHSPSGGTQYSRAAFVKAS